jgi:GNAT superfamily N-acetyltransferase
MALFGISGGADGGPARGLADALELRPVTIDDLSSVRFIHASAFRLLANACYPEEEIAAFAGFVYTQPYADLVRGENLLAGYLGNEMVATAGWAPADDSGLSARIRSVYVRPLFTGIGIGRRMALEAESWARKSGFRSFGARVTLNAVGFFETLGFEVSSHGVQLLPGDRGLPVSFMRKSDQTIPAAVDTTADAD